MRRAASKASAPRVAQPASFPAAVQGWVANINLASPAATLPQGAHTWENILPTATGGQVRRGSSAWKTVTDTTKPILSLFSYKNGNSNKIFAANDAVIYEVTGTPTSVLSGQTGGDWSVAQFVNANGAVFLRGVNGMNTPIVYDGTTFSTTPALTFAAGVTVTANQMSRVWSYQNRLFFIQKDSMDAWYLQVSVVGGQLTRLPLGGVFKRGGSLLFGSSWSIESGDGPNEYCAFVSTEGEVAVYQGTDPGTISTWSLIGVYRTGKPLGPNAFIRAGGDLVIATYIGFIPLSQAMQRDYAALSPSAISFNIETAWNDAVSLRSGLPWACEVWPELQIAILALPTVTGAAPQVYVVNTRTGAWSPWTGWDARCMEAFNGRLFFGTTGGKVVEAYTTGMDMGMPFTSTFIPLFSDINTPLTMKIAQMARAVIRSPIPVNVGLSVQADYIVDLPPVPDAAPIPVGSVWGTGVWGTSVWGAGFEKQIQQDWTSASGAGYAIAPCLQITSGAAIPLDAEIIRIDMTFEMSDIAA